MQIAGFTLLHIHRHIQGLISLDGFFNTHGRNLQNVRHSRINERVGRGAGDEAGDIGYAVVDNSIFHEGGPVMSHRARGLETAAFVGAHIDQVGGQAVLGRQNILPTPWLTERHGYDPTCAQ